MKNNHWKFNALAEVLAEVLAEALAEVMTKTQAKALNKANNSLAKALQAIVMAVLLQGCVSTEELYAEYDEQACRVSLVKQPDGVTVVQELVSTRTMTWEPSVLFALDSANLGSEQERQLDVDVAVLKRYPELRISIRGYADDAGNLTLSRDLASRRIAGVVRYLRKAGISRARMQEVSVGEGLRIYDNRRSPISRRVELVLTDVNGNLVRYEISETPSVGAAIEE